ncbi:MAG: class I SAM-dependent methyltransferase [Candidatus Methanoperedens sp.]|nr:class I SAM-dependent methyltransferase [Candidatus Methanoperedens sp.]MCZ7370288.1 class I SAM-dependent methyltransferase [Candidatus Methanoperedens sp.]
MDTIEIKDGDIDVEDIMRQIRENIKKRKESGAYTKELEAMINEPLQPPLAGARCRDLKSDLNYVDSNWDINAEYVISSHRKIIGKPLVWGRRLINSEMRRYVDLINGKQIEFNAHVAGALKGLDNKINEAVADIRKGTDSKINEAMAALSKDIDLTQLPGAPTDDVMNYFLFEEKFRGSTEDIRKRQSVYLEYFKNCKNVLDIGCGRGEFLSLLKENGIGARGIDMNEDMVLYCQKNGLEVSQNNALSYLTSLSDKSLDGIFSAQVVEHLQPADLISLIKLTYDKMQYGSYFIAETINPMCLSVFASSFCMDLSHVKPIHPETIKFLLESVGFREIQFIFLSSFHETIKLAKLKSTENMNIEEKMRLEVMNQNIDKLNSLLYGYQDYAVIGKK